MTTKPLMGDRDKLEDFIRQQVLPGRDPEPYTDIVRGVNAQLKDCGMPITKEFQTVVEHNIVQVERRQISDTTAHWNEAPRLMRDATSYWQSGDKAKAAVCFGGAVANLGAGWMSANSKEFSFHKGLGTKEG